MKPIAVVAGLAASCALAQVNPALLSSRWPARWIAHPMAPAKDYGVFHFRRHLKLDTAPAKFVVHVTADNRYELFVNGTRASIGPARGDAAHWRYETADLAPLLHAGDNVLAAVVWNYGRDLPAYQVSVRTGFLVQGDGPEEAAVNTDDQWRVFADRAYSPMTFGRMFIQPFEVFMAARYPWGWEQPGFDDSSWAKPELLQNGEPYGHGTGTRWALVPRPIPPMELTPQRLAHVRRVEGTTATDAFLAGDAPVQVPAHSSAVLVLDQGFETVAYPELVVSGGGGARVTVTYAEALVDSTGQKRNRNDVDGMHIDGYSDVFVTDGAANRIYRPLWLRAYRYIELKVETADAPLTLDDFRADYTGYPLRENATFESGDPSLKQIWQTGWRTARLCAGETYYDCPYYEQLQYVGDTRIQALISLYMSGDDRLMRNAIRQFNESRISEGLTQSRYPSSWPQVIPPFSLFWVDMVHDYWMHRDDRAFVGEEIGGVRDVLDYHLAHRAESGMLGVVPWWNFVDWPVQWPWDNGKGFGGVPPHAEEGDSTILTLQLVYALERGAQLMDAYGQKLDAARYRAAAAEMKKATLARCWDTSRGLLADSPHKDEFSQHANAMAILVGLFPPDQARAVMERTMADTSLVPCTFYYRFDLYRAIKAAGLGDRYIEMLGPWRDMLSRGLTTFAEKPDPTRSDCHAWSASPNYELLASVAGIEPSSPGFRTVHIAPHLGSLEWVKGSMPHPNGEIAVDLKREGTSGIAGSIRLPAGIAGDFEWNGAKLALHAGDQQVHVP